MQYCLKTGRAIKTDSSLGRTEGREANRWVAIGNKNSSANRDMEEAA